MNWPQSGIGSDQRDKLVQMITTDNFKDILRENQCFYDGASCGSAIEFDSVGEPVSGQTVEKLTLDLRAIKDRLGINSAENKKQFDQEASARLQEANIPDNQGWNPNVWIFLQLTLFDVVHWRWARTNTNKSALNIDGKKNISYKDRLFSKPINRGCLSRLWLWNKTLIDPAPPEGQTGRHLIEFLQEDNKVAIIERTTCSSDGRLALAIAGKYSRLPAPAGANPVTNPLVLRRVMKLVIFKMAGIETLSLDETQLAGFVDKCFEEAQDAARWNQI